MSRARIPLLVATGPEGGTILRAPAIGLWTDGPEDGAGILPGSPAGTLTQLGHRFALFIPDEISGRVVYEAGPHTAVLVEFGQPLFRVAPHAPGEAGAGTKKRKTARAAGGAHEIVAPTDGVFYQAPSTGAAPYVAPGDRIKSGAAVGLIEVMKTFNPIAYGGGGLPDEALVVEVLVADGQEVRAGQALVIVKAT